MNQLEESHVSKLEELLNSLDNSIFSKEKWNDTNVYKIPEVTYSYETYDGAGPFLNLTLFRDIGGLDLAAFNEAEEYEKHTMIDAASNKLEETIQNFIGDIEDASLKLKDLGSEGNPKLEIIHGGLVEIVSQFKACLLGIPLEKEKALFGHHFSYSTDQKPEGMMTDKERDELMTEIRKVNASIYMNPLSTDESYVQGSIDYYFEKYESYKAIDELEEERILSEEERVRYEGYLQKLGALSPNYNGKKRPKPKKYIDHSFDIKSLSRDSNLQLFNNHFQSIDRQSGNMTQEAILDDSVASMTDTPQGLSYPGKDSKFDSLLFSRVFKLMSHEIEQHGVSLVSHETLVGNIRGAKNLELAEGAAKLNEDLFEYGPNLLVDGLDENGEKVQIIDLEKLQYVSNFPKTLMEEILTDEEFLDFLILNDKVEPDKSSPLARYLRHKRTGMQMKDVTYTTGKIKAAQYFNDIITGKNKDADFTDLYIGKVGFDQIPQMRALVAQNDSLEDDDEQKLKLPQTYLFHEALYYAFMERKKGEDHQVDFEGFYVYMSEKYPFADLTKEKIQGISFGFKRQLLAALKILEATDKYEDVKDAETFSPQVEEYIELTAKKIASIQGVIAANEDSYNAQQSYKTKGEKIAKKIQEEAA